MKKAARLMIFFSLQFIIFFLLFVAFRFLGLWIDAVRQVSVELRQGEFLAAAVRMSLPAALFLTILFSLGFSVRERIPGPLSIFFIIILAGAFTLGFFLGIERIQTLDLSFEVPGGLSERLRSRKGLILSREDMSVVLLGEGTGNRDAGNSLGIPAYPRVVSFPERPLLYQEAALGPAASVPPLPFPDNIPWIIKSVLIDFTLAAREFHSRFGQGLMSLGIYGGSLIFLLASLRFVLNLSSWPLANLFLGALFFRLILSLQIFLLAPETLAFLNTFLENRLPEPLISPAVFLVLGVLITLYTFLAFVARRNKERR